VEKPFVLLADDNEATCTLIRALLQNEFAVEIASDGHEAIDKVKRRPYAAILLDLLMPIADGYTVLDFLKSERPELLRRVLVVTAAVSPRDLKRVSDYPISGVVAKPFEVDVLQGAVRRCAHDQGQSDLSTPLMSGSMLLLLADLLRRV
jgi:CheY-like chemotaxis protein